MRFDVDDPTPGSPEAIAKGCTCDQVKNRNGKGEKEGELFYPDWKCPLHGLDAIRATE